MLNAHLLEVWCHDLIFVWMSAVPRQAALILLVALLIRLFSRTSAAWRHWMWWLVAMAIGMLPLAAVMLPRLPVIPAEWLFGEDAALVLHEVVAQSTASGVTVATEVVERTMSPVVVICALWLLGLVWLLFRVLAGFLGLRSFQRGRRSVIVGRLCARMERCRRLAGVTTVVDLYLSPRSPLPMTWGVVTPAINLPQEAVDWSDDRLDAVFMHELGHIKRADCWSNLVLRVVCAANWFNPFIWMAASRAYLAQEQACDDFACIRVRASDYATHLLQLASIVTDGRRLNDLAAVGFWSGNHLQVRLTAALDPLRHRDSLSNRVASAISFAILAVAVTAAMVSFRVEESHAAMLDVAIDRTPAKPLAAIVAFDESLVRAQHRSEVAGWRIRTAMRRAVMEREMAEAARSSLEAKSEQAEQEVLEASDRVKHVNTRVAELAPRIVRAKVVHSARVPINAGPVNLALPSENERAAVNWPVQNVHAFHDSEVDWNVGFGRSGHRVSGVKTPAEELCVGFARMSAVARARAGGFSKFLTRNGVRLSPDGIRDLIVKTRARLSL